jgi:hypothetical protein
VDEEQEEDTDGQLDQCLNLNESLSWEVTTPTSVGIGGDTVQISENSTGISSQEDEEESFTDLPEGTEITKVDH